MKFSNLVIMLAVGVALTAMTSCGGGSDISKAKMSSSELDSASYSFGVLVGQRFFPKEFYKELNVELLARGIMDVRDSSVLIEAEAANDVVMRYNKTLQESQYEGNISEGKDFLANNAKRSGVKTTASGLQYEVVKEGTGPKPSGPTDKVTTNYTGTFINGEKFDGNEGMEFALNQVIPAWTEGIQLMNVGSKYKFYVPQQLGYGERGSQSIEPYKTLIFEVELLKAVAGDPAPPQGQPGIQLPPQN